MARARQEWVSAEMAAKLLGVKQSTLYAYVSRGLVRSQSANPGQRGRRYCLPDLERLRARSRARKGHAAVAEGALLFGEPVLDTSVSRIDADGPRYRGQSALSLVSADVSPERVAELLFTGVLPEGEPSWPEPPRSLVSVVRSRAAASSSPLQAMLLALAALPFDEDGPGGARELDTARILIRLLAVAPVLQKSAKAEQPALTAPDVASALLAALGRSRQAARVRLVSRALVLCADHELNASTFAARVAAGASADLPRCLSAALCVFSGSRHGGACDAIERFIQDVPFPERALSKVKQSRSSGTPVPGFGHPLYPDGDPRAAPLIEAAESLNANAPAVRTLSALREAMELAGGEPPTIDHALVVASAALELPPGSATAIFAVGRAIGYVAHALEQRASGQLLRPRARYVGP